MAFYRVNFTFWLLNDGQKIIKISAKTLGNFQVVEEGKKIFEKYYLSPWRQITLQQACPKIGQTPSLNIFLNASYKAMCILVDLYLIGHGELLVTPSIKDLLSIPTNAD